MIKVNKGSVEISGNGLQVTTEFSLLVHVLLKTEVDSGIPEDIAKKMLRQDFETGLKTEKEIKKEADKIRSEIHVNTPEISKPISDLLDSIFGGNPNDDN